MLIGIEGKARSGKDTVGKIIQELLQSKYKQNHQRYAFAQPIKEAMNKQFGWGDLQSDGALKEVPTMILLPSVDDWIEIVGEFYKKHTKLQTVYSVFKYGELIHKIFNEEMERMEERGLLFRKVKGSAVETYAYVSPRVVYQLFGTELMREGISHSFWIDIAPTEDTIITDVRFKNEAEYIHQHEGITLLVERPDNELNKAVATHSSEDGTGVFPDYTIVNDGDISDLHHKVEKFLHKYYY